MITAYIALGSNLGDKKRTIGLAANAIRKLPSTELSAISNLYRTVPESKIAQPSFINAVAKIKTRLTAPALLKKLRSIEAIMGRTRNGYKNSPRIIDLDILLYGDMPHFSRKLKIPHPKMHRREFVLTPLSELEPNIKHPILNVSAANLLRRLLNENNQNHKQAKKRT